MIKRPRPLDASEIETLLALDVPGRLATVDRHGFPHITPLWFVWHERAFYMTSLVRITSGSAGQVSVRIAVGEQIDPVIGCVADQ